MLELFERADRVLAKIWGHPLKWLCWATGRDNFFFSAWAEVLGLIVGITVMRATDTAGSIESGPTIGLPLAVILSFVTLGHVLWVNELRKESTEGGSILRDQFKKPIQIYGRIGGSMLVPLTPVIAITVTGFYWGFPFFIAADYFAMDYRPKQKSPFRKGVEWLKRKLTSASIVQPSES